MQKKIAIIGFGNQGRAWALNLRESAWEVGVFSRTENPRAKSENFVCHSMKDLHLYPHVALLIPDHEMPHFEKEFGHELKQSQSLIFAHGFSLHFKTASWPKHLDLLLLAPKGIGTAVRKQFLEGSGVPAVLSIEQNISKQAEQTLQALAQGLGCDKGGLYFASAEQEVKADLLSEQSLLCGGVPFLLKASFDLLVSKGISPEVAYLECLHELAFMADLFSKNGIAQTMKYASPTAQFGGAMKGSELISPQVHQHLSKMMLDIENGEFKSQLDQEAKKSFSNTKKAWQEFESSQFEQIGRNVRKKIRTQT